MVTQVDIYPKSFDEFEGMRRFGFVRDAECECVPGDFVILYELRDGSYGIWARHRDLLRMLRHIEDLDGICSRSGKPVKFAYWHLVS